VEACRDCLVITRRAETLVSGLSGHAVVETEEGLLAVPLDRAGDIRSGVEKILEEKRNPV
jgi:hypothetical protein